MPASIPPGAIPVDQLDPSKVQQPQTAGASSIPAGAIPVDQLDPSKVVQAPSGLPAGAVPVEQLDPTKVQDVKTWLSNKTPQELAELNADAIADGKINPAQRQDIIEAHRIAMSRATDEVLPYDHNPAPPTAAAQPITAPTSNDYGLNAALKVLYGVTPDAIMKYVDPMIRGTATLVSEGEKAMGGDAKAAQNISQAYKVAAVDQGLKTGLDLAERVVNKGLSDGTAAKALDAVLPTVSPALKVIRTYGAQLFDKLTGNTEGLNSVYDTELNANTTVALTKRGLLQGVDSIGHSVPVDPEKIAEMQSSPLIAPYLMDTGLSGVRAAEAASATEGAFKSLSTMAEEAKASPGILRQTAALPFHVAAGAANKLAESPITTGLVAGGAATAAGASPLIGIATAISAAASEKTPAILERLASVGEKGAAAFEGKVPLGPVGKFVTGAMDLTENAGSGFLVSQFPQLPWILGADDRDQAGNMIVTGALLHAGSYGAGRAVNGLNVVKNLWAPDTTIPVARTPVQTLGVDPVLDAAHQRVSAELNNASNNFVQGVAGLAKRAGGEAYVMYNDDFAKHLDSLVGQTILPSGPGSEPVVVDQAMADNAKRQAGWFYSLQDPETGKLRNIAITKVSPSVPGVAFGHEVMHLVDSALDPETRDANYQAILNTYGTDQAYRYKKLYDRLVNGGAITDYPASWDELSTEQRKGALAELWAETGSAVLNSIPLSSDNYFHGYARNVYSTLGRLFETLGVSEPMAVVDEFYKAVDNHQDLVRQMNAATDPKERASLKEQVADSADAINKLTREKNLTKTGVQPSAKVGHILQNTLQAFNLDAPKIALASGVPPKLAEPIAETPAAEAGPELVSPDAKVSEIPGSEPAVVKPKPVGFKKGDPIGEIRSSDGTLLAEDAKVVAPAGEKDGTTYYKVEYTHPDSGEVKTGVVPEQWLISPGAKPAPKAPAFVKAEPTAKNIRVTPEKQASFGKQATPEVQAHNEEVFKKAINSPRTALPLEIVHSGASTEGLEGEAPDAIKRERQRLLSEAATNKGLNTTVPGKQANQKIIVPFKEHPNKKGVYALDYDKIIQNQELLEQWQKEHKIVDPALAKAPAYLNDYLRNQTNGYAGTGERIQRPKDTLANTIPDENPDYTPVPVPRDVGDRLNMLMGYEAAKTKRGNVPASDDYFRRFAEMNGLKTSKTAEGTTEVNPFRAEMVKKGFNTDLLNEATSQIRYRDIVSKVKERPDLGLSGGSTGITKAGFLPEIAEGKRAQGNDTTRKVAEEYARSAGLSYVPHEKNAPVNEDLAKRVANFYQEAKHDPANPDVQKAYKALVTETKAQYQAMKDAGIQIEPFQGKGEPYPNSKAMMADVRDNKHLFFLKTDGAFGSEDTLAPQDNPLLEKSGVRVNGQQLLNNDLFGAVHDYFGHTAEGYEFGPRGEYNAYLAHSRMFSDAAKPALAAETLAQNSWVNFGEHLRRPDGSLPAAGDEDFKPLAQRPFAEQKSTVIPQHLLDEADASASPRFLPSPHVDSPEFKEWFGDFDDPKAYSSRQKGPLSVVTERDADGKLLPQRVFHATNQDFTKFETGRPTANSWGLLGTHPTERHAIFVTPDPRLSNSMVEPRTTKHEGSRTVPLYANIKYPLDLYRHDAFYYGDELEQAGLNPRGIHNSPTKWELFDGPEGKTFVSKLKEAGFDGVIFPEDAGDGENNALTYAVFSPNQLKSVYGNRGSYDSGNPDIRFQPSVAATESEPLEHSVGDRDLNLVHYGTPFSMDISPSRLPGRDQPGYAPLDQVKDQLVGKKGGQMAIGERYAGQANHPEAVPLRFQTDKNGKVKLDKDGEPKIATQPYDFFSGPLIDSLGIHPDVLQSLKTSLNTTTLKQIKDGYLEKELSPEEKTALHKVTNAFAERAVQDFGKSAGSPEVRGAAGWYSDIADFFKKLIPDEGNRLKFLEFLGGTSPNTDVESNFLYALDLYNRFVRGDLEQHHAAEQYVHKNYDTLAGKYAEKKPVLLDSGAHATAKGVPQYSWELKPEMAKQWQKDHYDALISDGVKHSAALDRSKKFSQSALDNLLYLQNNVVPRRQGGGKYGVHTDRILQILDGVWRDATDAPKAPNFTENLAGVSTRATIDVWAARWLRRLAHEGLSDKAWRLLPMAEQGVGNADFFLGQHVFDEATRRINGQYSEQLGRPINPDDLQAIMWFAEKRLWKDKGWKQSEDLGDFRQYAHKLTPNPDGSFSLRNVTLNRSSPDFLGTLSHVGLENAVLMSERRSALKGALEGARAMKKLSDKGLETSTPMANASAKFLENLSKLGNVVNK